MGIYGENIKSAIADAVRERNSLKEDIASMEASLENKRQRLADVEGFIQYGAKLLKPSQEANHENNELFTPAAEVLIHGEGGEDPELGKSLVAQRARDILADSPSVLKLTEIAEEFHKRQWELSENNGKEVLRLAMNKRPGIFKKHGNGYYGLVSP